MNEFRMTIKTNYLCMKKYSLLLACLVVSMFAMSQKAVISFNEKSHDFGKVKEEDGKITYVFDFVNRGNSPLVVSNVKPSCGCTTPTWTKEPIEPGKKGIITVTYNPSGRPGPFTKTITVSSNATEEQVVLNISGEVIGKQSNDNVAYPINMGGLMTKLKVVQLNNVDKGKTQTRTLDIQNSTKNLLKVAIEGLPSYITYSVSPQSLKPNEEGKITFTFNSNKCTQWGPVSSDVYVSLNGTKKFTDEFRLVLMGNVTEDFGKMTLDQKRKAPILEVSDKSINLGTVKLGAKKVAKFKLSNKGQNALEVRKIINKNKELTIRPEKISIPGGKSAEITVEINTKNSIETVFTKYFSVQTNDPDNSMTVFSLNWKVEK